MAPTAPPDDPDALDEYVRELVRNHHSGRFDRFEVEGIEYVRTNRAAATGGAVPGEHHQVIFVQVMGDFVISAAYAPRRPGSTPRAVETRLLSWTLDARTGRGLDGGWGGARIDMSRLGEVRRPSF